MKGRARWRMTKQLNDYQTEVKMANDAIGSEQLKNLQTLVIYDSAGATLKTLYTAGT